MEDTALTATFAVLFGAAHAIEPGHGKTALFTYLASGKCTWKDGIIIALSSSLTHSLAVLILALLSHTLLSHNNINQDVENYLRIISSAIIGSLGVYFLFKKNSQHNCHSCDQDKGKSLLTSGLLGFATGLIPCPSIVVAYLSGISSGDSLVGLKTVIFFALGMATSLIGVVILFSFGSKKISHFFSQKKLALKWNKIQGVLFISIGLFTYFMH